MKVFLVFLSFLCIGSGAVAVWRIETGTPLSSGLQLTYIILAMIYSALFAVLVIAWKEN